MAKLVIWASGYARPMVSASTTGRSVRAATSSGCIALPPPISRDMTARNARPRCASIGDDSHEIVVVQSTWVHEHDAPSLLV
jgi:hypothetical protein